VSRRGAGALLVLTLFGAGCSPAPPQNWDGSERFGSLASGFDPGPSEGLPSPAPLEPPEGCDEVLRLSEDFGARLEQRVPPSGVLDTMELCLAASGRLYDLAALLRRGLTAHPEASPLRQRFARTMLQLGDVDEARRQAEEILRRQPDDPEALFLLGLTLSQRPEPSAEQLRQARAAWRRLLDREPNFVGLGGYDRAALGRSLDRIDQELGDAPPDSERGAEAP